MGFNCEGMRIAERANSPQYFPDLRNGEREFAYSDCRELVEHLNAYHAASGQKLFYPICFPSVTGKKIEHDARVEERVSAAHSLLAGRT